MFGGFGWQCLDLFLSLLSYISGAYLLVHVPKNQVRNLRNSRIFSRQVEINVNQRRRTARRRIHLRQDSDSDDDEEWDQRNVDIEIEKDYHHMNFE